MSSQKQSPVKAPDKQHTVLGLLDQMRSQIEVALPKHLDMKRMVRIVCTEINKTPKLKQCDPFSFIGAVLSAAQLGLEPGQGCYLIPYGRTCQMIPSYKGRADLVRRSGRIKGLATDLVRVGDKFWYGIKDSIRRVDWEPGDANPLDDSTITHVVSTARYDDGSPEFIVMKVAEVNVIRDVSLAKAYDRATSPWTKHYGEMVKKTGIHRLCKLLPTSPEIIQVERFDEHDGVQPIGLTLSPLIEAGIIDADYAPAPEEVDVAKGNAVRNDATPPPPMEHEKKGMEDERNIAIDKFHAAHHAFKQRGGQLGRDLIKKTEAELLSLETPTALAAWKGNSEAGK